jgi:hypothetical protein
VLVEMSPEDTRRQRRQQQPAQKPDKDSGVLEVSAHGLLLCLVLLCLVL